MRNLWNHGPVHKQVLRWLLCKKYRVVKYDLPPDEESWYLVRVGWLGLTYGVPGSDMGCPGEYNYQLANASNPVAALSQLFNVAAHHLNPTRVKRRGRDKLPRAKIVEEIDTVRTFIRVSVALQLDPNISIQELNKLVRAKYDLLDF